MKDKKLAAKALQTAREMYRPRSKNYSLGTHAQRITKMAEGTGWGYLNTNMKTRKSVGAIGLGIRRNAEHQLRCIYIESMVSMLKREGIELTLDFVEACSINTPNWRIRRKDLEQYLDASTKRKKHSALDENNELKDSLELDLVSKFYAENLPSFTEAFEYVQAQHNTHFGRAWPKIEALIDQHFKEID